MKLALNGALTIGTLDGANIEIRDHVGADNIFIFGLRAEEVRAQSHGYDSQAAIMASPRLAEVIAALEAGAFSPDDRGRFQPLTEALRHADRYMVTADFDDYYDTQRQADRRWNETADWNRASILNIGRMGWFSSDRTIGEYAREVWNVAAGGSEGGVHA